MKKKYRKPTIIIEHMNAHSILTELSLGYGGDDNGTGVTSAKPFYTSDEEDCSSNAKIRSLWEDDE